MIDLLIIAGPTASGKTGFAIQAAKALDGEIVSCDSMQIYRFMDIGTAKPTKEERAEVPHHLIDVADPRSDFTAADYAREARAAIRDIDARGKLPILCGGTGLYLNSILYVMDFGVMPADTEYRSTLEELAARQGSGALHEKLSLLDPEAASRIHPNNKKKLIRALERLHLGEGRVKDFARINQADPAFAPKLLGIHWDREVLYERINARVDDMFAAGLVREVEELRSMGLTRNHVSMQGIGYREVMAFLEGETDLEEAVRLVKRNTRHYAKRQFTWFRRYDTMTWVDGRDPGKEEVLEELISWRKRK